MDIELNDYQERAMSTCMSSCRNMAYMLTGLNAEVGELNDKIAKAVRRGDISLHRNQLALFGEHEDMEALKDALLLELGDVLWFVSGIADVMGWQLRDVAAANISKLADRARRNVIDGNGDNR